MLFLFAIFCNQVRRPEEGSQVYKDIKFPATGVNVTNTDVITKIKNTFHTAHIVKFSELLPTMPRLFISDWIRA